MRLDRYLTEQGLTDSREKAKKLILAGLVSVDGRVVKKPAEEILGQSVELLGDPFRYVGRGGEKLQAAISLFSLDPVGKRALDIGASTGGFTDCLLQHGAALVVALDTGVGQLHEKLRDDARVINLEKYNARDLRPEDVGEVSLVVMDVSFISATYILPRVAEVLNVGGEFVCLIKPQFEAGRAALNKQGVVKKEQDKIFAIRRVLEHAAQVGLQIVGLAPSPIVGGDGNEEFLAYFRRVEAGSLSNSCPIEQVVREKAVVF